MGSFIKKKVDFRRCSFTLKNSYDPNTYKDILGKKFYYGFPLMRECTLLAIITPAELISNFHPEELGYDYNKARHASFYIELLNNYGPFLYEDFGLFVEGSEVHLAVFEFSYEFRKYYDGSIYPMTATNVAPLQFLIEKTFEVKFRTSIGTNNPKVEQEFPRGKPVVINTGRAAGSTGFVTKYAKAFQNQLDIEVQTYRFMREDVAKMVRKITLEFESHQSYWRVQDVADSLGISFETILMILGSIIIKSDQSINAKSIYAEKFDVGLNLVKSKYNMLVPELIIFDEKSKERFDRNVKHFFISPEAKELVDEYYKNCKQVILALEERLKNRDPEPLNAKGVFRGSEDPNLDLLKVYIWILKTENANLIQYNQSSKVLPREGIRIIEQYLKNTRAERSKPPPKEFEYGTYNPNYLYPQQEDYWIPPSFTEQPAWHFVGDRVVNLKCVGYSLAPFGAQGTVVGILGNKFENDVLEIKIEVLFDDPFIGGTNLGGRCSWGRGAIVNFCDVYNIKWARSIIPREKNSFTLNVWDGSFKRRYVPKFNDLTYGQSTTQEDENPEKKTEKNTKNVFEPFGEKTAEGKLKKSEVKVSEEVTKSTQESQIEYIEAPVNPTSQKYNQKQTHIVAKNTIVQKKPVTKQPESVSSENKASQSKTIAEEQKVVEPKSQEAVELKSQKTDEPKTHPQIKPTTEVKSISNQNTQPAGTGFNFDDFLKENTSFQQNKFPAPTGKSLAKKIVQRPAQTQQTTTSTGSTLTSESILSQIQGEPKQTHQNPNVTAESILSQIQGGSTQAQQTQVPASSNLANLTEESTLNQIKDAPVIKTQPKENQGFDFDSFAKNLASGGSEVERKEQIVTEYRTESEGKVTIAVEVKQSIHPGSHDKPEEAKIDTQSLLNVLGVNPTSNTESTKQPTGQKTIEPVTLEKDLLNILDIKDSSKGTINQAQLDEEHLKSILQINPSQNT